MAIKYYLRQNNLKKDTTEYRASVVHGTHVTYEQVIQRMVEQGSTVGEADVLAVLFNFQKVVQEYLKEGCTIKTPIANFSSSIKGSFTDISDVFDSGRHKVAPVLNAGNKLHAFYRKGMTTEKVAQKSNVPNLRTYKDIESEKIDTVITPNGIAQIWGSGLKYDQANPSQGIFFIDQNGKEYKVSFVSRNSPSCLDFKVPADLPKGTYQLSIRSDNGTGVFRKDLVV